MEGGGGRVGSPSPHAGVLLSGPCSLLCQGLQEKDGPLSVGLVLVTAETWLLGNPFCELSVHQTYIHPKAKAFVPGVVHAQPGFTVEDKTKVPAFRDNQVPEMGA